MGLVSEAKWYNETDDHMDEDGGKVDDDWFTAGLHQ